MKSVELIPLHTHVKLISIHAGSVQCVLVRFGVFWLALKSRTTSTHMHGHTDTAHVACGSWQEMRDDIGLSIHYTYTHAGCSLSTPPYRPPLSLSSLQSRHASRREATCHHHQHHHQQQHYLQLSCLCMLNN